MTKLNPDTIAKIIGVPVERWPGNCHGIAIKMVEHKIVRGKAKYGIYHGEIDNKSIFKGRSFTHHGWIERAKTIVDPTRWVFEATKPYIFVGSIQEYRQEYDFGGNYLKEKLRGDPPPYSPSGITQQIPKELRYTVKNILKSMGNRVCKEQMMYLANTPLHQLGEDAEPLYKWIINSLYGAFIPIDNRMEVLGI